MEAIVKDRNMTMREYDYKGSLDDFAADNGYSNADTFVEKYSKKPHFRNFFVSAHRFFCSAAVFLLYLF